MPYPGGMSQIYRDIYKKSLLVNLEEIRANFPAQLEKKSQHYFSRFHINRIEDFRQFSNVKQPPYRKSVTEFLFLTRGSTIRSKGLNTYRITKGMVFFVPAYQIRSVEAMSADVEGYFCHFDEEIFNLCGYSVDLLKTFPFLQYLGEAAITVPARSIKSIHDLFKRLEKEYLHNSSNEFALLCTYLLALFHELNRFTGNEAPTKNAATTLTQKYKSALMEHIYDMHTVSEFAQHLHVSLNYLNRCVTETVGKTAHQMLDEMFILEAKTLLRQSALNISEIAFKIGKRNPSDFSRFFKKQTGLTPKEFRG
jgi:AraC-like DNA-binding protein